MEIRNHQLKGRDISLVKSIKNQEILKSIKGIIIHYTAGASTESSVAYLSNPNVKVSAHIVISPLGHIYQLVPFNIQSWHAGKSEYMGDSNLNKYSIGIELANYGKLKKERGKFFTWFKQEVPPQFVATIVQNNQSTYWNSYSFLQLQRAYYLCQHIINHYPIQYIVGHSDINNNKQDPGPCFPIKTFQKLCHNTTTIK